MDDALERIEMALGSMRSVGPRHLRAYLAQPGPDLPRASSTRIEQMLDMLLSTDPNAPARLLFSNLLRSWDNAKDPKWAENTDRNTAERRERIHALLQTDSKLKERIDLLLPFFPLDEPLVIAEKHEHWYAPQPGMRDYYWSTYVRYLRERRGWDDASLLSLDNSTRAIVECLANPEAMHAYASRGLVMGYVQSGKTANFTGVIARAADAGYRLIIVLAGTWNILRNQTQRRLDKELLGKELLKKDEAYVQRPPPDWSEFLEHGVDPTELGCYTWQRLTRPDIDFKRLKAAIDNLEFERTDRAAPIYDPRNLHALPVKLLVIKKHGGILHSLVKDLKLLRTRLTDLPALIIDDESDQAGLNTVDPNRTKEGGSERSRINLRIVELLRLFPRGQYVGYTATPYANALVDPDDPEDLFPKDFLVSLHRPRGYMGVSDFFDASTTYEDLPKDDYSLPEIALIRRVESAIGEDDDDLKRALRSYVLAGGIKLHRMACDPERYKAEHFKHHTMLVHTSQRKNEQKSLSERLQELWTECAFNSPEGLFDLEKLWAEDHSKVCAAQGVEQVAPRSVDELVPYLSEAIKRIETGPRIVLVLNSDSPDAPDFSAAPVWKVIVGGNKLSRGYTVEGLTVSYYRRVARTADTLMQMGRWFGFRPGYQDLVRVFLGVREGRRGESDLVALFKDVCRMEERFREELKRYVRRPGSPYLTPKEIPPLISVSASLPPTARNKMFNAMLASKNFGGQRSMLTLMPVTMEAMAENVRSLGRLVSAGRSLGKVSLGGNTTKGRALEASVLLFEAKNGQIIEFLRNYRWLETDYGHTERPADTNLQIEFLEKQKNHGISGWLIIAPQRRESFGSPLSIHGVGDLAVKERHRVEGRGFQVFGEPAHRTIAEALIGIEPGRSVLSAPNQVTTRLQDEHRAVLLLYPVRERTEDPVSVGFELLFPENRIPYDLNFTVRRRAERAAIVVPSSASI